MYSHRKIEYYRVKEDQVQLTMDRKPIQYNLANLSEEILKWIEYHGFDFLVVCNSKGQIRYVSSGIENILGYQTADVYNQFFLRYLPRRLHRNFLDVFQPDIDERQRFTLQLKSTTQKNVWSDVVIKKIFIKETQESNYIVLVKDMSDKKEAEEILFRSEKMTVIGQLASGVVHEIRNPLTSLKGFIELLRAGLNRKEEYYKIMIEEIEKIEKVSTELLYVSKPLTQDHTHQWLKRIIIDVITLLNTQAVKKEIKIDLICPEDVIVYADRSQLKQVFINLIKNAIEAMTEPGRIQIKVEKQEHYCLISVIDDGPGISEQLIHKIKEPFFTTKKDGTGLGLMVTSRIVENHNGLFNIKSSDQLGTVFEIQLPHHQVSTLNIE